ncbi:MAG: hypothetical protein HY859_06750 [Caulobacterales bacterium]|nr:hypothetical protein [Caulobacterales bacterium]
MWPFTPILNHIYGPREWCVITVDGTPWAQHRWRPKAGEALIRSNLRQGEAQTLALRMRQKAEDTPERVI